MAGHRYQQDNQHWLGHDDLDRIYLNLSIKAESLNRERHATGRLHGRFGLRPLRKVQSLEAIPQGLGFRV